jgi:hypothetical protein
MSGSFEDHDRGPDLADGAAVCGFRAPQHRRFRRVISIGLCGAALLAAGPVAAGLSRSPLRPTLSDVSAAEIPTDIAAQSASTALQPGRAGRAAGPTSVPVEARPAGYESRRVVRSAAIPPRAVVHHPAPITGFDPTEFVPVAPPTFTPPSNTTVPQRVNPPPNITVPDRPARLRHLAGAFTGGALTWGEFECPDGFTGARRAVLRSDGQRRSATLALEACETGGGRGGAPAAGNFEIATDKGSVRGHLTGFWTWKATDNIEALLTITSGTGAFGSLLGTMSLTAELGDNSVGVVSVVMPRQVATS